MAFYRDGLGLPEVTRFAGHDDYDGVVLDVPATGAHLEFTATRHGPPRRRTWRTCWCSTSGTAASSRTSSPGSASPPWSSANPYWDRVGAVEDPEGFRVVLVAASWDG